MRTGKTGVALGEGEMEETGRKPKLRGKMVVVFEMAADYFRGNIHQASETNGNMSCACVS